jgi:hypothetical protein
MIAFRRWPSVRLPILSTISFGLAPTAPEDAEQQRPAAAARHAGKNTEREQTRSHRVPGAVTGPFDKDDADRVRTGWTTVRSKRHWSGYSVKFKSGSG